MKHKPINQICLSISLWTTIIILAIALLAGAISIAQNFKQMRSSETKRLNVIAPLLADAISGNLAIEDERSTQAIINNYKAKYNLTEVLVSKNKLYCSDPGILTFNLNTCWSYLIEDIKPNYYLLVSTTKKLSYEPLKLFLVWTFFPLLLLGSFISIIINNKLKRTIVNPIVSLAENPKEWAVNNHSTATEVIDLSLKINNYIRERDAQVLETQQLQLEATLGKLAARLAHDIRSPLVALDIGLKGILQIPEERRLLLRNAANRIRDIANNLLSEHNLIHTNAHDSPSNEPISELILSVISEKRMQHATYNIIFEIDEFNYNLFAKISPSLFKRVLSNLIDNSIEASKEKNSIQLNLHKKNDYAVFSIIDKGTGIPESTLNKIKSGQSYTDKKNGHGIGLISAMITTKETWEGEFTIDSIPNIGTEINIKLPICATPEWFAEGIEVTSKTVVIVVDDDLSIHQVWKNRFAKNIRDTHQINFTNLADFALWYSENINLGDAVYLIDYEFINSTINGLDFIVTHDLVKNCYLVTSHYIEQEVRRKCLEFDIKIIPKSYAPYIKLCYRNLDN